MSNEGNTPDDVSSAQVIQLTPAEPGWLALVVQLFNDEDEECGYAAELRAFRVVAWGLQLCGQVVPVYHCLTSGHRFNGIAYEGDGLLGDDYVWRVAHESEDLPTAAEIEAVKLERIELEILHAHVKDLG